MKIRAFPAYMNNSGCGYHRVHLPFMYSSQWLDNDAYKGFCVEKMLDYMAKSQLVVYNRYFPLGLDRLNDERDKHGFKVICDLDDWLDLPDYHPNFKEYKHWSKENIIKSMRSADAVTVSTARLADRVKEFNKNIYVLPNALPYPKDGMLPYGSGQFIVKRRKENELFTFVYTGQVSHIKDVTLLKPAFGRLRKDKSMRVMLAGYKPNRFWNQMEEVFSIAPNYKRIDQLPLNTYMDVYNDADCALVPLCDNFFNAHKSNLKVLEAAAKKIPCIVSHVPPYSDDKDAPVMWVKKPGDWQSHMKYLCENRTFAKDMGQALFEWASKKYNLFHWTKVRGEVYKDVLKTYQELKLTA
ncbi:MAG TPA: glycosyltransferase [Agriterribacter sp.]|uniref:glycosyltransferase n=1 Tax=Agriterribacter sp. TaxID=2821509 RepID=UPI002B9DC44D|nr:glycosyltransferase [Agriterribacter sp.]HRQ17712.1 glycosyltransferase [Agriterribacter sp.]